MDPHCHIDRHGMPDGNGRGGRRPGGPGVSGGPGSGQASHRQPRRTGRRLSAGRRPHHDCSRLGRPYGFLAGGDSGGRHHSRYWRPLLAMDTLARTAPHGMINPMNGSPLPGEASPARLETRDLTLAYGERSIVDKLSLTVPPAKVTAIVGPNECGKSTLLAGLARILAPRSGCVVLDGRIIHEMSAREVAHRLGLLPQGRTAPDGLA